MRTVGPNDAGGGFSIYYPDEFRWNWYEPGNICSDDELFAWTYAHAQIPPYVVDASARLVATGFQFGIARNAIPVGIKVEIKKWIIPDPQYPWGEILDCEVGLAKNYAEWCGDLLGTNQAHGYWGAEPAYDVYGGESDLWGREFTPCEIMRGGGGDLDEFAVFLSITNPPQIAMPTACVGHVRMTAYVTFPTAMAMALGLAPGPSVYPVVATATALAIVPREPVRGTRMRHGKYFLEGSLEPMETEA